MTDIAQWLAALGLGQYAESFEANDIDGSVLADLTDQDLKEIGVASVGHRRRLMVAIAALNGAAAPPAPPSAPAAAAQAAAPRTPDGAERRQVSVMFCDLVDSTLLSGNIDPEDLRDIIGAFQAACTRVIKSYDGFVAKYMGDGILAYFGYPRAHEDAAERAAHAGLAIVEQLKTLHSEASPMLQVRIGIATGLVVIGDIIGEGSAQEEAIVGQTPNLAARLQTLATPGAVVVSSSTRQLLGGVFSLQTLGAHELKGFAKPVEAWQVTGERRAESRFEAAHASRLDDFIGRESETGALLAGFERACGGDGQVVLIAGEAGIGKSRLVAQFSELIGDQPVRVRYQCSPHHRESPLYPVIQQLHNAFDLQPGDSDDARLDKLEAGLRLATQRVEEIAPLFASLLSIAPGKRYPALSVSSAQQRRQTLAAILDQMEGLARQAPLIIVCEDVHWADATTLEVLDLAIERLKQLRVLMLLTFRPEFEPPWIGLKNVSQVALARLHREDVERIATQVLGGRSLPPEVMSQIVAKTDGVPLFVEELTKTVAESGVLITEGDHYRVDGALPPLAIPSTLQDSLMARLDRLAPLREIVQYAAAIGREFSRSLLLAAAGCDAAVLDGALAQLEASELVFRAHGDGDPRYVFKHALVQDAAYDSLLKNRRQTIHRRIAEVIIERFGELAALQPEVVAHHLAQGGLGRQAVEWWGRAGESALRRAAFAEALTHFQRATELADRDPDQSPEGVVARLRLQIAYGQALLSARGYSASETAAAFSRARDLARSIEDPAARIPIYYGLWAGSYVRTEVEPMREMADLIMLDAAKLQGAPELHLAHRILGVNYHVQGDYVRAAPHLQLAVDGYDRERDAELAFRFGQDVGVAAMIYLAVALWPLGETERGEAVLEEALALAQRSGQPASLVIALFVKWMYADWRGDKTEGVEWARALIALARDHGMQMWRAFGAFLEGWANWTEAAEPEEEAIAQMHRGIAECRAQGIAFYVPLLRTISARAELAAGRQASALAILDDVIAETAQSGQLVRAAETMLARAETLAADPQADDAECEQAFLDAVAVAEAQQTKMFRLRASLSLARYYDARRRRADAAAALERGLEGCPVSLPEVAEAGRMLVRLRGAARSGGRRATALSAKPSTAG
jgi:class 3 adenylate cyclase/predicted ATPase